VSVLVVWGAIRRKGGSLGGFYIFNPKYIYIYIPLPIFNFAKIVMSREKLKNDFEPSWSTRSARLEAQ
jgi:hypothetical protein